MRLFPLALLGSTLLTGCYLFHTPGGSPDGSRDGGVSVGAGSDGGAPIGPGIDGGLLRGDGGTPGGGGDGGTPITPCGSTSPAPCTVAVGADIWAIAIDDTRVYWVEHGTFDSLGNHRGDGALRATPLAGGAVMTIANDLDAPIDVGVTTSHVYVGLARSPRPDGTIGDATARLPIAGGPLELLTEHRLRNCSHCFESIGDRAVWADATALRTQTAVDARPVSLREGSRRPLTAFAIDETHAYFLATVRGGETRQLFAVPFAGGDPASIGGVPSNTGEEVLARNGAELLSVEWPGSADSFVSRKPIVGGAWMRAHHLPAREYVARLWAFGTRFVTTTRQPGTGRPVTVSAGAFETELRTMVVLSPTFRSASYSDIPVAVNDAFVFWASDDGTSIQRASW